jgi:hypothetical protein
MGRHAAYAVEFRLRHKDGTWRWILARGEALRNRQGRPYRMAGFHTDITERKEAEQQLVRYKDHLEELVTLRTGQLEQAKEVA